MKKLKTVLFQKDSTSLALVDATLSAVAATPEIDAADSHVVFDYLIPEACKSAVAVIPAELVSLHAVHLPVRTVRQRLDALPFALEERVAQNLEKTHFAVCGAAPEGDVLAASLDSAVIENHISRAPGMALIPEQMLLPPPDPDPEGRVVWRTYCAGQRVLVRLSDHTGFAVHREALSGLWILADKPRIENLAAPLPKEIQSQDKAGTRVASGVTLFQADLRQGIFRPAREFIRPLKWLAASVALVGMGHLLIAALDTSAQRKIADGLRAQAGIALNAKLANASPDDPPALVLRRLAAENQPQGGSGFLPLMERVSTALRTEDAPVQFRELSWSDGALRITIEAVNLDSLQKAEARLDSAGLQVSSGSATADAGAARAEMTVRP